MSIRAVIIIAIVAASFGAGWAANGWRIGAAKTAEIQAAIAAKDAAFRREVAAHNEASAREVARIEAEAERDAMAQQLEDAANADQTNDGGLSIGRVQRLNSR